MCVLRGRGARERPWSNTGWVVVLSIHVLTDPIGSPCADPVLSLASSMRNGPETFPEHSSKPSSEASTGLRHAERSWNIQEHSWNIPEHSSKADEDSGMQNVLGTFRNIPRTYRIGRTHPVLHLCSLSFRTDPIPSVILFIFFFPLSILLFSFVFFLRNRPYQADSTTSRPICEVKLPRARVVLRWGTTWEVRVLILLRVFNARFIIIHSFFHFFFFLFFFKFPFYSFIYFFIFDYRT